MPLIPSDIIAQVRERTDIVSIIGDRVLLRQAGVNYRGLCPFHEEKTPSFNVNPAKQFFYCFGCQKSGDVFSFLTELEGRTFADVLQELAQRSGVELPKERVNAQQQSAAEEERTKLLRLHELVADWFSEQLHHHPKALAYVNSRAIDKKIQQTFRLGYAPDEWNSLLNFLQQKKVPLALAETAGLIVKKPGADSYDRFRNRLIFPVFDLQGRVIAFGGRVLPNSDDKTAAKYLNSPESPLYKKGDHLYGLAQAKESIRQFKQAILVEGNIDVLAMHEHGFSNTIAPMGTALTEGQAKLLKRLIGDEGQIVLMLDGDSAGEKATLKDVQLFSQENLQEMSLLSKQDTDVRVVRLPAGEDPDSFVRHHADDLRKRVTQAKSGVDFMIDQYLDTHDSSVASKARVLARALPLLRSVHNRAALELYIAKLASDLNLAPSFVFQQLRQQSLDGLESKIVRTQHSKSQPRKLDAITYNLLALFGDHPQIIGLLTEELLATIEEPALREIFHEVKDRASVGQDESITAQLMVELAPIEWRDLVASAVCSGTFSSLDDPKRALSSISDTMRLRRAKQEQSELRLRLQQACTDGDQKRIQELTQQIQNLTLALRERQSEKGE